MLISRTGSLKTAYQPQDLRPGSFEPYSGGSAWFDQSPSRRSTHGYRKANQEPSSGLYLKTKFVCLPYLTL